jgi:hypothetical protein
MSTWEVMVSNIGRVFEGTNGFEARATYNQYIRLSKAQYGRASGEGVTLWRDGEITAEYSPHDDAERND